MPPCSFNGKRTFGFNKLELTVNQVVCSVCSTSSDCITLSPNFYVQLRVTLFFRARLDCRNNFTTVPERIIFHLERIVAGHDQPCTIFDFLTVNTFSLNADCRIARQLLDAENSLLFQLAGGFHCKADVAIIESRQAKLLTESVYLSVIATSLTEQQIYNVTQKALARSRSWANIEECSLRWCIQHIPFVLHIRGCRSWHLPPHPLVIFLSQSTIVLIFVLLMRLANLVCTDHQEVCGVWLIVSKLYMTKSSSNTPDFIPSVCLVCHYYSN